MVVVDPDLSSRLADAVKLQAMQEPDMYLVSSEGTKIPAHRSVIALFSPLVKLLLEQSPLYVSSCILLPDCSYTSLCSLVGVFYTGVIPADPTDDESLAAIEDASDLLGFHLKLRDKIKNNDLAKSNFTHHEDDISKEAIPMNSEVIEDSTGNINLVKGGSKVFSKCQLCEYSSEMPINLMKHYSVDHFESNLSQLTNFYYELDFLTGLYGPCKVCSKVLTKNSPEQSANKQVLEHVGVHHMKIVEILKTNKIDLPTVRVKSLPGLQVGCKPSPAKKGQFKCEQCPFKSPTRTEFQDHLSGSHFWTELVEEFGNKYTKSCSLCQFKFQTLQQLSKHIGTIHNKVMGLYQKKKEIEIDIQVEELTCNSCHLKFIEADQLSHHNSVSHYAELLVSKYGSYGTQCTLCFAWLNTTEELAVHIGVFHGKVSEMISLEESSINIDGEVAINSNLSSEEVRVQMMVEKSKKLMISRENQKQSNVHISMNK